MSRGSGKRTGVRGWLLAGAATALIAVAAGAQTARPDRPDVYVVKKGDTLWDISDRFLNEPWLWPEIWEANPQIENPHLIYPGDEVSLVFVDGQPRLRVRRGAGAGQMAGGRAFEKLSPRARVVRRGRGRAIPAIPLDAIGQFLSRPRVVAEDTLRNAPYIVSVGKEHLVAGQGFRVYARGEGVDAADRFSVFRAGPEYRDPDTGEILGYGATHLASAALVQGGDPATLRLLKTEREVLAGDRLLPAEEIEFLESIQPSAPSQRIQGRIIAVDDGVTQIGRYQVVVVNLGGDDGIEPGHLLAVHQAGGVVPDRFQTTPVAVPPTPEGKGVFFFLHKLEAGMKTAKNAVFPPQAEVQLPDERAGVVLVFRSYDRLSYALVMKATRAMHVDDLVLNP